VENLKEMTMMVMMTIGIKITATSCSQI